MYRRSSNHQLVRDNDNHHLLILLLVVQVLPHFHLICTKPLYHHMHKIDPITIILIHNKLTHHHILLIHNSHNLLTLMSHCHISHNTPRLLVHLLIVLILQSCWLYKSNGNAKKNWIWSITRWRNRKKKEKE